MAEGSDLPMQARLRPRASTWLAPDNGLTTRSRDVKFMLMMNAPGGKGDWQVMNWQPDDLKAHIAFMMQFNKELRNAGELVAAGGLAVPGQAKLVRARGDGTPEVTDGPFAEAKEFLAGYWIPARREN